MDVGILSASDRASDGGAPVRDESSKDVYHHDLGCIMITTMIGVLGVFCALIGFVKLGVFGLALLCVPHALTYRLRCWNDGYEVSTMGCTYKSGSWDDVNVEAVVFVLEVVDKDDVFPPEYKRVPALALRRDGIRERDKRGYLEPSIDFNDLNWQSKVSGSVLNSDNVTAEVFVDYFARKYGITKAPPVPADASNKTKRYAKKKNYPIPMTPLQEAEARQEMWQQQLLGHTELRIESAEDTQALRLPQALGMDLVVHNESLLDLGESSQPTGLVLDRQDMMRHCT